MTDTFAGATGEEAPDGGGEFAIIPPTGRVCQEPGCANYLPEGSHPARKYCVDHFVGKGNSRTQRKEKAPKLVVELAGPKGKKGDQRAAQTAAGARAFANVVATGFAMSGDDQCAAAVVNGAGPWSDAVGELSKYQPWLAAFFAPVGEESQLGAWLGFVLTTGAIALPIMAHHGILPESVGAKLGGVFVAAEQTAGDGSQQPAA